MRDFVIAALLEPATVGDHFTRWPLHVTVLPWFTAPDSSAVLDGLRPALSSIRPLKLEVGERAFFSARKLPVRLIQNTVQLQQLHETLLAFVQKNGWPLAGRYVGAQFKPHVTQKLGEDAEGTYTVHSVWLAEALPQNYRQLVAEIKFGAHE